MGDGGVEIIQREEDLMKMLKRYFVSGLLVGLPVFLSLYFIFIIFKFIDGILGVAVNRYLMAAFGFFIPGAGIIMGLFLVLLAGFIVSHLLSQKALPAIEKWFLRLPAIRQIYPPIKEMVGFIFSRDKPAFRKVVMVEYPCKGIWSIGFMTNEGLEEAREKTGRELVHVLIGSTPSPWSGFFILIPKDEVMFLEMAVEDGIKLIIAGGIMKPARK